MINKSLWHQPAYSPWGHRNAAPLNKKQIKEQSSASLQFPKLFPRQGTWELSRSSANLTISLYWILPYLVFLIILLNLQPNNIPDPTGYQPSEESCVVINIAVALLKLCWLEASIPQLAHCWTILFFSPFSMDTQHTSCQLALKSVLTPKCAHVSTFQFKIIILY